jgi:hypothetical protein
VDEHHPPVIEHGEVDDRQKRVVFDSGQCLDRRCGIEIIGICIEEPHDHSSLLPIVGEKHL